MQKIKKYLWVVSEQNFKQTPNQRGVHWTFTSWIQNINSRVLGMFLIFIESWIIEMVKINFYHGHLWQQCVSNHRLCLMIVVLLLLTSYSSVNV